MKIYINCFNSNVGGGVSVALGITTAFVEHLKKLNDSSTIYIFCSSENYYLFKSHFARYEFVCITQLSRVFSSLVSNIFYTFLYFPLFCFKTDYDLLLNLADIPIPFVHNQVYYFDWPYATCSWLQLFKFSRLNFTYRSFKRLLLTSSLFLSSDLDICCQTNYQKDRLSSLYKIDPNDIVVYPNPSSTCLDSIPSYSSFSIVTPSSPSFVCMSSYYPHKNLEIFLDVSKLASSIPEQPVFILTFDPFASNQSLLFQRRIDSLSCKNVINIGPVPTHCLDIIYSTAFAVILPSLLESYSGCYNEAFSYGLPVLTSRLPFATDVCGDAAYYFNPLNPTDIVDQVVSSLHNPKLRSDKINIGHARLANTLSWSSICQQLLNRHFDSINLS